MLNGHKIVIAGAGGLLGARIVVAALKQGAHVLAVDIDLEAMSTKLSQQECDLDSSKIQLALLDVTNESQVKAFFTEHEGITGAVNGTYPRNKTYGAHFFDVSLDSFNDNISLHLGSTFLFTQQCAAYFKANEKPFSLVNISSIYGVIAPKFEIYKNTPMTMPVEYAAIKAAILHLNKYVSAYVNDSRFRINSVSPGGIFDNQPEAFLGAYKTKTHGAGMLDVDDVVGSILYLLSEQSKFVVGQNIIVDDGFSLS
jgi:NAD(P)-dependent dehydrogenase (short-subunit alcohol dehydrogenase family)